MLFLQIFRAYGADCDVIAGRRVLAFYVAKQAPFPHWAGDRFVRITLGAALGCPIKGFPPATRSRDWPKVPNVIHGTR